MRLFSQRLPPRHLGHNFPYPRRKIHAPHWESTSLYIVFYAQPSIVQYDRVHRVGWSHRRIHTKNKIGAPISATRSKRTLRPAPSSIGPIPPP